MGKRRKCQTADELNEAMDDDLENSPLINAVRDAFPALTIEAKEVHRPGCEPGGPISALMLGEAEDKGAGLPKTDIKLTISGSFEGPSYWDEDAPDEADGGLYMFLMSVLLGHQAALDHYAAGFKKWHEADEEGRKAMLEKSFDESLENP